MHKLEDGNIFAEFYNQALYIFNLRPVVIVQCETKLFCFIRRWAAALTSEQPLISWTAFGPFSHSLCLLPSFLLAEHTPGTRGPRLGVEVMWGVKGGMERGCEETECELWGEWIGTGFYMTFYVHWEKSLSMVTLFSGEAVGRRKLPAHIECICLVAGIGVKSKKGPLLCPAFII